MVYSDFTIEQVIEQFELAVQEQQPIIESQPVTPNALLVQILKRELPWAVAVGSEIARYRFINYDNLGKSIACAAAAHRDFYL